MFELLRVSYKKQVTLIMVTASQCKQKITLFAGLGFLVLLIIEINVAIIFFSLQKCMACFFMLPSSSMLYL